MILSRNTSEIREAEEWQRKEEVYQKKAAESVARIREMECEIDELRKRARQADLALDEEKQRNRERERDLQHQLDLMIEAEEIAQKYAAYFRFMHALPSLNL